MTLHNVSGNVDTATLVWGTLFGAIGTGYFIYGKRQHKFVPLLCGMALIGYTWAVSNPVEIVGIGAALMAVPFFIRQ